MKRCGVIVTQEQKPSKFLPGFINNILSKKLVHLLLVHLKKCKYSQVQKIDDDIDVSLLIAELPLSSQYLDSITERVMRSVMNKIHSILLSNDVKFLVLPKCLGKHRDFLKSSFIDMGYVIPEGEVLLLCLIVDILKKISKVSDNHMCDMDICIFSNQITTKTMFVVNLLSSCMKYITLITQSVDMAERFAEDIFENTGLAVRVTDTSLIKRQNSNVLFVFDSIDDVTFRKLANKKTIIFNLGSEDRLRKKDYGIFIDGINVNSTKKVLGDIDFCTNVEYYKIIESAILAEVGKELDLLCIEDYFIIRNKFFNQGYKISGLTCQGKPVRITELDKSVEIISNKNKYLIDIEQTVVYNRKKLTT